MTKIRERIEYINMRIKEELRGELMEYDREDDTEHVFKKYEKLKAKLISEIGEFDKEDFEQYLRLKKF